MKYFETIVNEIGELASDFELENMMILFGDNAPEGLKEFCYNIKLSPVRKPMDIGDIISFDNARYKITSVGSKANDTFEELGHMTVKFDGKDTPDLPGTVHVEEKDYPKLVIGSIITLEKE